MTHHHKSSIISIEIGNQWLEIQWKYQGLAWHVMRIKVSAVHPRIAHSESQNVMFWQHFSTECAHVSKLYNLRHDFVFLFDLMENSMRLFVWFIDRILGYFFSLRCSIILILLFSRFNVLSYLFVYDLLLLFFDYSEISFMLLHCLI